MRMTQLKPNDVIEPCPACGNNTDFTAHSQQIAEDLCEVWVECECGFDPTLTTPVSRVESVMGGTGDINVQMAFGVWNELLSSSR